MRHRRLLWMVLAALTGLMAGSGCYARGYGHTSVGVSTAPPAPRSYYYDSREGSTWIEGRWLWGANGWQWRDGYWIQDRPGYVYVQGYWNPYGSSYNWVDGYWARQRPGYVYVRGYWGMNNGRRTWVRGDWQRQRPGQTFRRGKWTGRGNQRSWQRGSWSQGSGTVDHRRRPAPRPRARPPQRRNTVVPARRGRKHH